MRSFYKYLFLIFMFGCTAANQKKQLLGNWYAQNGNAEILEFQFYNDSLIIYDILGKYSQNWKINDQKIFLTKIHGYTNKKELTYEYRLNKSKKSLHLKIVGDSMMELPELIKAENAFSFFEKLNDLKIELPITESELKPISQPKHLNFNIYAGYKNNILVVKTNASPNLSNLNNEVKEFKDNSRDELKKHLRFNLIADKNLSETRIDSIKDQLKKTSIQIIFRTYKSRQTDYRNTLNWFAKKE